MTAKESPHEKTHEGCVMHAVFGEKIKRLEEDVTDMKKDIFDSKVSTKVVVVLLSLVTPAISALINFALQHWVK